MNLEDLKKPLADEAITQHPTKTYLSSIKAVYVTERFNEVFGIGKWQTRVEKEHVNHETGMVVVKVIFTVPELDIYYESFGGNDNGGSSNKNFDLGDAYKGATTDAITKIGSFLGVAIDVFKGLKDNKKPSNKDNTPVIWITDKQVQTAISKGEETIKDTLAWYDGKTPRNNPNDGKDYKYCASKANKEKLQKALENA